MNDAIIAPYQFNNTDSSKMFFVWSQVRDKSASLNLNTFGITASSFIPCFVYILSSGALSSSGPATFWPSVWPSMYACTPSTQFDFYKLGDSNTSVNASLTQNVFTFTHKISMGGAFGIFCIFVDS